MKSLGRRTFLAAASASAALSPRAAQAASAKEGKRSLTSGGLSKNRLERVHQSMAGYVERKEIPGIVSLVSRHGEASVDVLGTMSEGGKPMRRDTIFRIASMSKPVTAVATMILVEESKLRLNEPVARLLPELANRKVLKRIDGPLDDTVAAARPITVRDLLTFRLGYGLLFGPPDKYPILKAAAELNIGLGPPSPATMPAPDEWIRRFGTLPLMYQPGERWMYNTSADVLSVLVSRASGKPFETFLRERIFDPLGMKDTSFSVPPTKIDRLATSYWTNFQTGKSEIFDAAENGQWSKLPAFPSGAGGLVSTVDDYYAFGQMMLNKGKHGSERILSRPSIELMTTDQLTAEQKALPGLGPGFFDSHGWGFCMSIVTKRTDVAKSVGTFGWNGGLGTCWDSDPKEDMVTILLTQRAWTSPSPPNVCLDFWTSAYQAIDD